MTPEHVCKSPLFPFLPPFLVFGQNFDVVDKNMERNGTPDNREQQGSQIPQCCTAKSAKQRLLPCSSIKPSNPFCNLVYFLLFLFVFLDHFHVLPLKFTKHLDMYNPDIPEWREDIGRVVTRLLAKVLFQIAPNMLPLHS